MECYKGLFHKHGHSRFHKYLQDVKANKTTDVDDARLPHELLPYLMMTDQCSPVALQRWNSIVTQLRSKNLLCNCLAIICDLSISTESEVITLRNACAALALLIAELGNRPWANSITLLGPTCQQISLPHGSYEAKLSSIHQHASKNTNGTSSPFDFTTVFHRVLDMSVAAELEPQDMVRTIFVFTDKNFDHIHQTPKQRYEKPWWRLYKDVCARFRDKGYQHYVPQIVLWNMAGPRSAALTTSKNGVMTLSGFSDSLMKLFLDKDGVVEPEDEMNDSIAGDKYQELRVLD
ncbi:hypothetical protein PR202_gb03679 [Eleusine coracana subsp. coracana]|uniref:DUF7788 domain-containing protein n=1 Tax=Eleusine coracana subsp. coracana TaxID=191504 RepID=A0AAV5E031_ELECO|nr:hypothetical protein PR202_gb03679 [Eleusine coracana subsp. coracana]